MPDSPSPRVDLPSTNPMVAYTADVERLRRPQIAAQDDAWLTLAHALWRLPSLTAEERRTVMPEAADALAAATMAAGLPATAPMFRVATALRTLYTGAEVEAGHGDAVSEVVFAVQGAVEELEIAGGFSLAYATLTNLETALRAFTPPRVLGNLGAQQGRALRQLGLLDAARDLYVSVMEQGYDCDAHDVISRGLLGQAIVATSKGNYPAARDLYERSLANAEAGRENDLLRSAHHGLMTCGFASGDLDAAMVHGWNVLRLCVHPDARAEALLNMGEVCRLTGELEVALRVFTVAKDWTSVPRIRLHATSSALLVAATLKKLDVAESLTREIRSLLETVGDAYARAGSSLEFAQSLHLLGDVPAARAQLALAHAMAVEHQFHEFAFHAERLQLDWDAAVDAPDVPSAVAPAPARPPVRRSEPYRVVLRSLRSLTASRY